MSEEKKGTEKKTREQLFHDMEADLLHQKLEKNLEEAFEMATVLEAKGKFYMHVLRSGLIALAEQIPDKSFSRLLRAKLFEKGSSVKVAAAPIPLVRNTAAPVYGLSATTVDPSLEEDPSVKQTSRFTAKAYGEENQGLVKKKVVPAVETQTEKPTTEKAEAKDSPEETKAETKTEPKVEKPVGIPDFFLDGAISRADIQGSTAEALSQNLDVAKLTQILNELGEEKGSTRTKIALAKRIKASAK